MKLFVLASTFLDQYQQRVMDSLLNSEKIHVVGVCIDNRNITSLQKLKREWGKGRGGYILILVINKLLSKFNKEPSISSNQYYSEKKVPIYITNKLYSNETIEFIKEKNPDCIFRSGFGIIREPILSLASKGVISYHHGNIRKYRGTPAAFWELYNGESEMGVTVQVLNEGLDSGKIAKESNISIYKNDSWGLLLKRIYDESFNFIYDVCLLIENDTLKHKIIPEKELGDLYTYPNFRQWLTLQIKVLIRKFTCLFLPVR